MVRQTALTYLTRAGVEIGVASTKAFTTQLTALFLLTLTLGQAARTSRRRAGSALAAEPCATCRRRSRRCWRSSRRSSPGPNASPRRKTRSSSGAGLHYPIALEGALKLKEISYIHGEAYPAGELKHGPLALVDANMPVVAIAPNDALLEKLKSNLQEVRARGGELYVVADADSQIPSSDGIHVLRLPEHAGLLSPIVHTIPLQLLAYHTAVLRGTRRRQAAEPGEVGDGGVRNTGRSRR